MHLATTEATVLAAAVGARCSVHAGEALIFDNYRTLHGRDPFVGGRLMWRVAMWTDERMYQKLPDVCLCGCGQEWGGTDRDPENPPVRRGEGAEHLVDLPHELVHEARVRRGVHVVLGGVRVRAAVVEAQGGVVFAASSPSSGRKASSSQQGFSEGLLLFRAPLGPNNMQVGGSGGALRHEVLQYRLALACSSGNRPALPMSSTLPNSWPVLGEEWAQPGRPPASQVS